MIAASPEIQTPRLRLRWITKNDAPLMLAVWNDPDFIRHVGDRGIRSEEEAAQALQEGVLKLYEECGYGPYVVSSKSDGKAMGICGLFKRDNLPDPDIGYGFLPEFCAHGYAIEAAREVVAHARNVMQLSKILAIVSPGHERSISLLEKLGMAAEGTVRMPGEDKDLLLYSLTFKSQAK